MKDNMAAIQNILPTASDPISDGTPWSSETLEEKKANRSRGPAGEKSSLTRDKKGTTLKTGDSEYFVNLDTTPAVDTALLLGNLEDATKKSAESRTGHIRDMMDLQANILKNTTQRLDLSPLMALVDNLTGSNFSKTYSPPTDAKTNAARVDALEKMINQEEQGINSDNMKTAAIKLKSAIESDNKKLANEIQSLKLMQMMSDRKGNGLLEVKPAFLEQMARYDSAILAASNVYDSLEKYKPVIGWAGKALEFSMMQSLPYAKKYAAMRREFVSIMDKYVQKLGRQEEGGVLRKDDWEKMKKIFGDPNNSYDVMLSITRQALANVRADKNIMISAFEKGKFDVAAFKDKDPGNKESETTNQTAPKKPQTEKELEDEINSYLGKK